MTFVYRNPHVPDFRGMVAVLKRSALTETLRVVREFAAHEMADFKAAILAQDFRSFRDEPLSEGYAELKRRLGLDPRTMVATRHYVDRITLLERKGADGTVTVYVGFDAADRAIDRDGNPTDLPLYALARIQEEGTENIPARPHWWPWYQAMRERAKPVRDDVAERVVRQARRAL